MKRAARYQFSRRLGVLLLLSVAASTLPAAETVALEVFPDGDATPAMVFEASGSDVVKLAQGYMVQGDVQLVFGKDKLTLLAANLFFQFAEGSERIERVRGTTYVPSPYVSDNVVIKKPVMAELGMDYGANLDLGVPLNGERSYLFFRFGAGFEMEVGFTGDANDTKPLSFEIPAGVKALLILDPRDPFFFFSGQLLTPDGSKKDKNDSDSSDNTDADSGDTNPGSAEDERNATEEDDMVEAPGFGASYQSLIPFRPRTVYGIEDVAREFQGDMILAGEVQLGALPLVVKGQLITGRALDEDSTLVERLLMPIRQAGANGELEVGYEFLKVSKVGNLAELSIPLGEATAAVEALDGLQYAYLSGKISPDTTWIPDWVPVVPEHEMKAYGYISSDAVSSRLAIESLYAVDMSNLGDLANVNLGRVIVIEGVMKINQDGFLVKGLTDADLGPFAFEAGAAAEVFFPFSDPDLSYAVITGRVRTGGVATDGVLRISKTGVTLNGRLVNDQFDLQAQLQLGSRNGVEYLAGTVTVPQQFNEMLNGSIRAEVESRRRQTQALLDAYRKATEDYELELSLRGMRSLIPGVCDGSVNAINAGINNAFKKWPSVWGIAVPGKTAALSLARSQAAPAINRLNALESAARKSDNATFRAALKAAINDLLSHQQLTIKVSVIGTVYSKDILSPTNESRLRTALAAIDSLPAASSRKISAQQAWEAAPVNEALESAFEAIQSGVNAAPSFEALGLYHELSSDRWTLIAHVIFRGERTVFETPYDPQDPRATVKAIAAAFIPTL